MKRITIMAAALALFVVACGSDNAFKSDFNEAQAPLSKQLDDLNAAPASDPKAYQAQLDKLADGLESTADRLRKLEAPDDAKDEFAAYVKEIDASAASVREVQKVADTPEKLAPALSDLSTQLQKVAAAETKLKSVVDG